MYGQRIKELRLEKGLKQSELAEILHTSQMNVCKYENEKLDLSSAMLIKLCKFFEVSADYILGIDESFPKI